MASFLLIPQPADAIKVDHIVHCYLSLSGQPSKLDGDDWENALDGIDRFNKVVDTHITSLEKKGDPSLLYKVMGAPAHMFDYLLGKIENKTSLGWNVLRLELATMRGWFDFVIDDDIVLSRQRKKQMAGSALYTQSNQLHSYSDRKTLGLIQIRFENISGFYSKRSYVRGGNFHQVIKGADQITEYLNKLEMRANKDTQNIKAVVKKRLPFWQAYPSESIVIDRDFANHVAAIRNNLISSSKTDPVFWSYYGGSQIVPTMIKKSIKEVEEKSEFEAIGTLCDTCYFERRGDLYGWVEDTIRAFRFWLKKEIQVVDTELLPYAYFYKDSLFLNTPDGPILLTVSRIQTFSKKEKEH